MTANSCIIHAKNLGTSLLVWYPSPALPPLSEHEVPTAVSTAAEYRACKPYRGTVRVLPGVGKPSNGIPPERVIARSLPINCCSFAVQILIFV